MMTRPLRHNQATQFAPNAVARNYPSSLFADPVGAVFSPPLPRGIRDTNGDFIYILANSPTQHSNPRYGGTRYVNQRLTTTIFA